MSLRFRIIFLCFVPSILFFFYGISYGWPSGLFGKGGKGWIDDVATQEVAGLFTNNSIAIEFTVVMLCAVWFTLLTLWWIANQFTSWEKYRTVVLDVASKGPDKLSSISDLQRIRALHYNTSSGNPLDPNYHIHRIYRVYETRNDPEVVDEMIDTFMDQVSEEIETATRWLHFAIWLLPLLGFGGTLVGISMGIAKLGGVVDAKAVLPDVFANIGLAFQTSILGLIPTIYFALEYRWIKGNGKSYESYHRKQLEDAVERVDGESIYADILISRTEHILGNSKLKTMFSDIHQLTGDVQIVKKTLIASLNKIHEDLGTSNQSLQTMVQNSQMCATGINECKNKIENLVVLGRELIHLRNIMEILSSVHSEWVEMVTQWTAEACSQEIAQRVATVDVWKDLARAICKSITESLPSALATGVSSGLVQGITKAPASQFMSFLFWQRQTKIDCHF